jgi:exosortase D (VPLPA-CTERM-specific)
MSGVFWIPAVLYGALLAGMYFDVLHWLIGSDWMREDYSHCYLIPLAVVYLIWEKRRALESIPSQPTWAGLLPVVAGVCCFWLGELAGEFFVMYLSLWLCILGFSWIHLGWRKLKIIGFPLILLLAMFPPPKVVNNQLTLKLKLISSQMGVELLQLWGMTAYREGNIIDIGYTQLQVVDACSGLRYLIPLMVLGLILAYWFKAPMWRRALLFLSTVPLAIVVNALRIAMTGVLYVRWGAEVAEGFFHGFSGWLIFMCTAGVLWGQMALLKPVPRGRAARPPRRSVLAPPGHGPLREVGKTWLPPASKAAILLLLTSVAFSHGVELREKIPVKRSLSTFPVQIGEWSGVTLEMGEEFLRELDLTTYLLIDFTDDQETLVNFYIAYYESQRKGESIHSPSTCMPGAGWVFNEAGDTEFVYGIGGREKLRVNRASMEKDGARQLVYYWFPMRGRVLTKAYELKLYTFWDALTSRRTDGALVRLITPIYPEEEDGQADARLQCFARQIGPVLDDFLPGK